MWLILSGICVVCAGIPCWFFLVNVGRYRAPTVVTGTVNAVSVLVPARQEAMNLEGVVRSALAQRGVALEVVVLDDGSTDGTGEIARRLAEEDGRVRVLEGGGLAAGWNGKQYACWRLAAAAKNPVLCFVDADVRLGPECVARMAGFLERTGCGLVSGFPRQETGTWMEWMLLPLIHFVLLGFLPMGRMRRTTRPEYAAGCGQFLMVTAEAYRASGGHAEIKTTMHDGLRLPKLLRERGFRTDLADLTGLATCRMYRGAGEVWEGLAKNAGEGLGSAGRIVPVSVVLVLGQVVGFVVIGILSVAYVFMVVIGGALGMDMHVACPAALYLLLLAVVLAWVPRWVGVWRFRQDWRGALLHPVGIVLLLGVQWYALVRRVLGRPVSWKARAYQAEG